MEADYARPLCALGDLVGSLPFASFAMGVERNLEAGFKVELRDRVGRDVRAD